MTNFPLRVEVHSSQHGNAKCDNYLLSNTTISLANVQTASLIQISGQLEERNNDLWQLCPNASYSRDSLSLKIRNGSPLQKQVLSCFSLVS